jgi:hypothetical protein
MTKPPNAHATTTNGQSAWVAGKGQSDDFRGINKARASPHAEGHTHDVATGVMDRLWTTASQPDQRAAVKGCDSFADSGDPRIRTDTPESDHVRTTCTSYNLARHPIRGAESMTRFLVPPMSARSPRLRLSNSTLCPLVFRCAGVGAVWSFARSPERDEQTHGLLAISLGFSPGRK